jgi:hypothetical protein
MKLRINRPKPLPTPPTAGGLKYDVEPEPEEEKDDLLELWTAGFSSTGAQQFTYRGQGLEPIPRPTAADGSPLDPQLPNEIPTLSSEEVGDLYAQFVSMCVYLEPQVALADVDSTEAEAYLEHIRARVRLKKTGTVPDKDSKTLNDQEFIKAEMVFLRLSAVTKLLRARLRGYEKGAAGLSRELSRRVGSPLQ